MSSCCAKCTPSGGACDCQPETCKCTTCNCDRCSGIIKEAADKAAASGNLTSMEGCKCDAIADKCVDDCTCTASGCQKCAVIRAKSCCKQTATPVSAC